MIIVQTDRQDAIAAENLFQAAAKRRFAGSGIAADGDHNWAHTATSRVLEAYGRSRLRISGSCVNGCF
jgi:hypothetical protein